MDLSGYMSCAAADVTLPPKLVLTGETVRWIEALSLLKRMKQSSSEPNAFALSAAIAARGPRAVTVFTSQAELESGHLRAGLETPWMSD